MLGNWILFFKAFFSSLAYVVPQQFISVKDELDANTSVIQHI
jgi:hypothetical protein